MYLTLRRCFYNYALSQVAYFLNKVILFIKKHSAMLFKYTLILSLVNGL